MELGSRLRHSGIERPVASFSIHFGDFSMIELAALGALAPVAATALPLAAKAAEAGIKVASDVASKTVEFAKEAVNQGSQITF
jgi:hypothetical protein